MRLIETNERTAGQSDLFERTIRCSDIECMFPWNEIRTVNEQLQGFIKISFLL